MNNKIKNNQENLEDKLYKINRNDPIFQIDENDPMCKEILENEEKETKEDLEFRSLINSLNFHKCSNTVEEKVMNTYRKEYRYRIFLYNIKIKFTEYKEGLFGTGRGLELAFASIVVLFILGGITYYQYTKPQSKPTDIIAGQETPIIKVNPNPAYTPIVTPSPIESIDLKVAINPNNNDSIRQGDTKENSQQATTTNDTKPHKPEEPEDDLYKEDNNIAINNIKRDKRTNSSVKINSAANTTKELLTLSNLKYVAVMDLKIKDQELDPIDEEIKQELIKAINSSEKWQLSSVKDAEAIFKKQKNDSALVLFDKKTANILWKSVDYINNYKNNKDYIKMTVETLSNYQKQ